MLKNGIIRRSTSSYITTIVPVIEANGSIRLCIDARKINNFLQDDKESPPGIEEIFKKCSNVKFITSLDMTASFWQIKLAEESKKYTAFIVNGKVYEFNVVPFGLKISTAALLRALDVALNKLKFILQFVDDLLCVSSNFKLHLQHLEKLFQTLIKYNITLNFEKTNFAKKEAKFLGHILSEDGIKQDPKKFEKIKNFPKTTKYKTTTNFLEFFEFLFKICR